MVAWPSLFAQRVLLFAVIVAGVTWVVRRVARRRRKPPALDFSDVPDHLLRR